MPESHRYGAIRLTTEDSFDQASPREFPVGAAALAALIWLVDTQGL